MIDAIVVVRSLAGLALATLAGSLLLELLGRATHRHLRGFRSLLAAAAAVLTGLQLAFAAFGAAPDEGLFGLEPLILFTSETWNGGILAGRIVLSLVLALIFAATGNRWLFMAWVLALLSLELVPLSGHAATAAPEAASMVFHGLHVAATLLWFGTLVNLAALAFAGNDTGARLKESLAAFSPLALALIVMAIVTGVAAGILQVGHPAALLGTAYGTILLVKAAVLLPIAIAAAAWLRLSYLKGALPLSPRRALGIETAAGLGMLVLGSLLSQSIPGRHDGIVWPLPFRFNWDLAWMQDRFRWPIAALLLASAVPACLAVALAVRRQIIAAVICLGVALNAGAIALSEVTVAAYPTTYAASQGTYSADRLAKAETLFRQFCTECHGENGNGAGILMQQAGGTAADLTAAHTRDHTAGDMFWWIGHGQPPGIMPGFAGRISDSDRWDLVNYVRLLTLSIRSTVLGNVEPLKPWLPAIDFGFADAEGSFRSLRDFEDTSAVLLVLAREAGSASRLAEIEAVLPQFETAGLSVVFVCDGAAARAMPPAVENPRLFVVTEGTADIFRSWSYYRRTPSMPDLGNRDAYVSHMEFLIDRFGYVRARWRADEGLFPPVQEIVAQARLLQQEPRLLPAPEEHVH